MKGQAGAESLVFVVDDDASMRQALESLLQSIGVRVEAFGSAADFLGNPHAEKRCSLYRARCQSGLDFQAEAKADLQIPIIFITGYGDIPMTARAMKAGNF